MPYAIETGIEPPKRGELAAALRKMLKGDSVAVENRVKATSAVKCVRRKKPHMRFSVRKTETGIRVWRVK